jgi:hypothetical protein
LIRRDQRRTRRIAHVPDHGPVVVALDGVLAGEAQIGVGLAEESLRRHRLRVDLEPERRFARVHEAALEAGARIELRSGVTGLHDGRRLWCGRIRSATRGKRGGRNGGSDTNDE